jgi:hypothetical protein
MAAKPLDQELIEDILIDWRLGQLSQDQIAKKWGVSKGSVNKVCKGIEQDAAGIVTAGIQYQQALHAHDDRIVTAVESVVTEVSKRIEWLNKASLKNVQEAMAQRCENQNDYRARADTISKAKDVVIGKTPETAIQINNSSAPQVKTINDFYSNT